MKKFATFTSKKKIRCNKCGRAPYQLEQWYDAKIIFFYNSDDTIDKLTTSSSHPTLIMRAQCECGNNWKLKNIHSVAELIIEG